MRKGDGNSPLQNSQSSSFDNYDRAANLQRLLRDRCELSASDDKSASILQVIFVKLTIPNKLDVFTNCDRDDSLSPPTEQKVAWLPQPSFWKTIYSP